MPVPGRKKSVVGSLFKPVPTDATFKTARVKCSFCSTVISKYRSRIIKHINKCEKCTYDIKAKYLTNSLSSKEMTSPTVKSPELHLSDDEQIISLHFT